MDKPTKYVAILLSLLMLTPLATTSFAARGPKNLRAGGVYVLTNQQNNAVAAFSRNAKGVLNFVGKFPTGGAGNPVAIPPDPPVDPLASQGALVISDGNHFLIAVNAGSNQISVLKINKNNLELVDIVNSGGSRPISLALNHDLLYVLNEGGSASITGFTFDESDGSLTPLAGSTRALIAAATADPAQVGFTRDGELLVVTDKAGNRLNTFTIDDDGMPSAPIATSSSGMTPFGFAFTNSGILVVSEAFGGAPHQGAASSYNVSDNGTLDVASGSVPNSGTASCWVVITNNGKVAFVSNTGSNTISSYRIGENGSLTLLDPAAATLPVDAPRDMALSVNSKILYVQAGGGQSIVAYRVGKNGSLTQIDTFGGLPFGAQGIAAK